MKKIGILKALVGLALLGAASSVQAQPIEIGSFTFDENADADLVGNTTGEIRTFRVNADGTFDINLLSVDLVMTDSDLNTGVFCQEPCTIELNYTDNAVVNGPGDDMILFEQGVDESTDVTINGTTIRFDTFTTEEDVVDAQGTLLSIYGINLDSFGVAPGETIVSVLIDLNYPLGIPGFPSSDPVALFALNSVSIDIDPSVMLGDGSSVGEDSVLKKGVTAGDDADIGEDVTLNRNVEAGDEFVVGDGSIVNRGSQFGDELVIGENVTIGRLCSIGSRVDIGDDTTIGQRCNIGDDVLIGSDVFIGRDVTVSSSQVIPNGSVVPAGTTIP